MFDDGGLSGKRYITRPGIQQALTMIEQKQANLLIFGEFDRAGRAVHVLLAIRRRVENAGGRLLFADGLTFEDNAIGQFTYTQMAAVKEFEINTTRERTMRGKEARAKQGIMPCRSRVAYGYIIPTKADAVRGSYPAELVGRYIVDLMWAWVVDEIFARYAHGWSLNRLAEWLNDQTVPPPMPRKQNPKPRWQACSIKVILNNPAYKGEAVYGRRDTFFEEERALRGLKTVEVKAPAPRDTWIIIPCPPIVSPHLWQLCQERLQANQHALKGNNQHKHLLSGWLKCPACGGGMTISARAARVKHDRHAWVYYRCANAYPKKFKGKNPPRQICQHRKHYRGDVVESAMRRLLIEAAEHPEQIELMIQANEHQRYGPSDPVREQEAILSEMTELATDERLAVKMKLEALKARQGTEVYDRLLVEINEKRDRLQRRLEALGTYVADRAPAKSRLAKIGRVMEAVKNVLTAPEMSSTAIRHILDPIVESIQIRGNKLAVALRGLSFIPETSVDVVNPMQIGSKPITP